jgi:DNA-binding winged helix-turn-helix (wHTH) protein
MKSRIRQPGTSGPPPTPVREVLRCGALRVDAAGRQAWMGDALLELQPKVFDLLLVLLREPGVVHTREALFERLWPGSVVLDSNLTTALSQLRRALDEPTRALLRTVPRVGYAFDGEVAREAIDLEPAEPGPVPDADEEPAVVGARPAAPVVAARRTRRIAWGLAAVLALAAGWLAVRPPPAPVRPILVLGALAPRDDADGASRWIGLALRGGLQRRLALDPVLRVVDQDDAVGAALAGAALQGATDAADFVLEGRWDAGATLQDPLRIELVLRRAADARPLWEAARAIPPSDLLVAVDALGDAVQAQLRPGRAPPADALAVPVAAVEAYAEGLRAQDRDDFLGARRAFEQAVARAPGFATAEMGLAEVLRELGYQSLAAAHFRRLGAPGSGLGDEARRLAQARAASMAGDLPAATQAYRALVAAYPDDPRHSIDLARMLMRSDAAGRREAGAILDGLAGRTPIADWDVRRELARAQLAERDGDLVAAARAFEAARDRADGAGLARLAGDAGIDLGRMQQRLGRNELARAAWQRAAADHARAGTPLGQAAASLNLLLAGRWQTPPSDPAVLRAGIEALIARARELGSAVIEAQGLLILADDHLFAEEEETALALATRAAGLLEQLAEPQLVADARLLQARLTLALGAPERALELLEPLSRTFGPATPQRQMVDVTRVNAYLQRGEVAAARKLADELPRMARERDASPVDRSLAACTQVNALRAAGDDTGAARALVDCRREPSAAPAPNLDLVDVELALGQGDRVGARAALERAIRGIDALPEGLARDRLELQLAAGLVTVGALVQARERWGRVDAQRLARQRPSVRMEHALQAAIYAAWIDGDRASALDHVAAARAMVGTESILGTAELDLLEAALLDGSRSERRRELLRGVQALAARAGYAPLQRMADRLATALADDPPEGAGAQWLQVATLFDPGTPRLQVQPRR